MKRNTEIVLPKLLLMLLAATMIHNEHPVFLTYFL